MTERPLAWLLALGLAPLACGGDDGTIGVGDTLTLTHEYKGTALVKRTFRVVELETPERVAQAPEASAVVLIAEREERLDGKPTATPALTLDALRAFLRDEWDPSIGTASDEGVDAKAFRDVVTGLALTPERFVAAYRQSGASLAEFTAFARKLAPLYARHGSFGPEHLLDLLEDGDAKLPAVSAALASRGTTHEAWVSELASHPRGVHALRAKWSASGATLTQAIAQPLGATDDPSEVSGVLIGNLAWDAIRNNSDVTTSTPPSFALNPSDADPTHYLNPMTLTSVEFDDSVAGGISGTDIRVHANVVAAYAATNAGSPGAYLPSIYVTFSEIKASSDASISVSASLTDISNVGTAGNFVPAVTMQLAFKATSPVWSTLRWTDTELLNGSTGSVGHNDYSDHSF